MAQSSQKFASAMARCLGCHRISKSVVDDFLLYLCGEAEALDVEFIKEMKRHDRLLAPLSDSHIGFLTAEYIAHRIFRKDGFAAAYADHPKVLARSLEEREYLDFQIRNPWRFSFCSIDGSPSRDFYMMKDALTAEEFLLYSPATTRTKRDIGVSRLYLYLIGWNGECYATYGPVTYFRSLRPEDLLYMARLMDDSVTGLQDVPALIDRQPIPFMLLISGSANPLVYHKDHELLHCTTDICPVEFNPEPLLKDFTIEIRNDVAQYTHVKFGGMPHFARFFHDKKRKRLFLACATQHGHRVLRMALIACSVDVPTKPQTSVGMPMRSLIHEILDMSPDLSPYDYLFIEPSTPKEQEEMKPLNDFLSHFIEVFNSGEPYDLAAIAKHADIPLDIAKTIERQLRSKMPPPPPRKIRR